MIFLKNDMHIFGTMTNKDFRADKKREVHKYNTCAVLQKFTFVFMLI